GDLGHPKVLPSFEPCRFTADLLFRIERMSNQQHEKCQPDCRQMGDESANLIVAVHVFFVRFDNLKII
ncbi:MAG: hypothetical protein WCF65_04785, partial [Parachlamydiaceae bacterium]